MELPLRVGLYARTSTHDRHTLSWQLDAQRTYADQRRWSVATEVQEVSSGTVQRAQRERLMQTVRRPGHGRPLPAFRHAAHIGRLCAEGLSPRAIA